MTGPILKMWLPTAALLSGGPRPWTARGKRSPAQSTPCDLRDGTRFRLLGQCHRRRRDIHTSSTAPIPQMNQSAVGVKRHQRRTRDGPPSDIKTAPPLVQRNSADGVIHALSTATIPNNQVAVGKGWVTPADNLGRWGFAAFTTWARWRNRPRPVPVRTPRSRGRSVPAARTRPRPASRSPPTTPPREQFAAPRDEDSGMAQCHQYRPNSFNPSHFSQSRCTPGGTRRDEIVCRFSQVELLLIVWSTPAEPASAAREAGE